MGLASFPQSTSVIVSAVKQKSAKKSLSALSIEKILSSVDPLNSISLFPRFMFGSIRPTSDIVESKLGKFVSIRPTFHLHLFHGKLGEIQRLLPPFIYYCCNID